MLIVYAHQEPRSFNGSLKKVAVDELSKQGCTVTVSDLYAMDFEPRATRKDITGALSNSEFFNYGVEAFEACKKRSLTSDIIDEQTKVQEADLVIFQVCFSSNYYNKLDSFYIQTPNIEFHAPRRDIDVFSRFVLLLMTSWVRRST